MTVTKEIKRLEKSNCCLTLTVPKDEVRTQYQDMLKDYAKSIHLPGFRKGKVPQEVLERKFGDALRQDALGRIIEYALKDIFTEEKLSRFERPLPYSTPELQGEPKLDFDQDLQFSVVYDVLPEVHVSKWKGLEIEHPYAEITEEDINRELEGIRERNAIVMDCDDNAPAKNGDVVTIEYQIFEEDGITPSSFHREDFTWTLGSNRNFYQFDDDIIGMKKGETKEFEKKFADDFFEFELAGSTRKVRITLDSLKEKKLPDIDDDLAQDVDAKYSTLDDLKNSIKEKLNKRLEMKLREVKVSELLKKIMENTPVILPESMIKAEIEGRWRRLARYYNTSTEAMAQMINTGEGHEKREKEWRETAEKALHSRIIIETLIEEQNFEITDEDVEREIERIAAESGADIEEVRKEYQREYLTNIKEDIKERRLIDMLIGENIIKSGKKVNFLDFLSDNT